MRNQVFQDDIRERKGEDGKDIGDLHRCPIDNSLAAESPSSAQCAMCAEIDFQACFGRMADNGLLLKTEAAPFGSRPQPMKFKMTNAVIATDGPSSSPDQQRLINDIGSQLLSQLSDYNIQKHQ